MTLIIITAIIAILFICYLIGTGLANVVIKRRESMKMKIANTIKENAEFLDVILAFSK